MTNVSRDSCAVLWFRRDLRLADHPALVGALAEFERVVPLFVWDPALYSVSGPNRMSFLSGCVDELAESLGGRLVRREGQPPEVVADVARRAGARAVFVTADFGPYGTLRDERVEAALGRIDVEMRAVDSPYAVAPGRLTTGGGDPYRVFTPFLRAWHDHARTPPWRRPALDRIISGGLASDPAPKRPVSGAALPAPGEAAAARALDRFVRHGLDAYDRERDRPDLDSTSRLSPYLRFGCLHPRQILARLDRRRAGHSRLESELCWREFYADVLFHRPDSARRSYRSEWRHFPVDRGAEADERFRAWAEGRTGYPIVDAGMRQLQAEGWMHNRVRMIVASFLVKDLHLDWRRGAGWFMRHLVDGDLASNQLNWQWVAGSGTDAAPYFRVFNPVTQGLKFDPDGSYIRRWVPELAGLAAGDVHEPWKLADGPDYPDPVVDHAVEREEALARYGRTKGH